MTDQELLEKAARAAGVVRDERGRATNEHGHTWRWDPLAEDGDAFRLMIKKGMEVEVCCNVINVWLDGEVVSECTGEWGPDVDEAAMQKATRRAIVRAAAAMCEEG